MHARLIVIIIQHIDRASWRVAIVAAGSVAVFGDDRRGRDRPAIGRGRRRVIVDDTLFVIDRRRLLIDIDALVAALLRLQAGKPR